MQIIFITEHKGWFQGFGLHHAAITAVFIVVCHYVGIGVLGASIALGWYGSREWGPKLSPPAIFEFWDFVSPAIVSILYLFFLGVGNV